MATVDRSIYPTQRLLGIISQYKRPKRFLLEKVFTTEQTFDTEEVVFGKLLGNRRLAPFVSPTVKGKPMPRSGESIQSFRPPYLKPKHVLSPFSALKTLPGESLQGELSPQARMDRIRAQDLRDQDDMITRREEWMASQLLRTGTLSVVAEDHPPMTINLGRPAGHTITLTGGDRWGESGVSPISNLDAWSLTMADASGATPSWAIMEAKAVQLLLADAKLPVFAAYARPATNQISLDLLGQLAVPDEVQYIGNIRNIDIYQYQSTYLNADGTIGKYMPDYTVILGSAAANGVRAYGAIQDFQSLIATSRFPKEWEEQDPSVRYTMTQSAPLPLLGDPSATFCATVR